jgi:hypothetical protein
MKTVVICGSLKHLKEMVAAKKDLVYLGHNVELPHKSEQFLKENDFDETTSVKKKNWYIKKHLEKIIKSDAVLVVNEEKNGIKNYIGGNTFLEMGFAFAFNKLIFLKNPIPDNQYKDEIQGMLPVVLNGDLSKIK